MEQHMLAEAEAEALAALGLEEKGAVVVTASEGWHPGIVGLVAARLKDKFGRPAFAIALGAGAAAMMASAAAFSWEAGVGAAAYFALVAGIGLFLSPVLMVALSAQWQRY